VIESNRANADVNFSSGSTYVDLGASVSASATGNAVASSTFQTTRPPLAGTDLTLNGYRPGDGNPHDFSAPVTGVSALVDASSLSATPTAGAVYDLFRITYRVDPGVAPGTSVRVAFDVGNTQAADADFNFFDLTTWDGSITVGQGNGGDVNPVPAPGSLVLLTTGIAAAGLCRRVCRRSRTRNLVPTVRRRVDVAGSVGR
jgi:hypothetical protein